MLEIPNCLSCADKKLGHEGPYLPQILPHGELWTPSYILKFTMFGSGRNLHREATRHFIDTYYPTQVPNVLRGYG
jgi:hypothetical protein